MVVRDMWLLIHLHIVYRSLVKPDICMHLEFIFKQKVLIYYKRNAVLTSTCRFWAYQLLVLINFLLGPELKFYKNTTCRSVGIREMHVDMIYVVTFSSILIAVRLFDFVFFLWYTVYIVYVQRWRKALDIVRLTSPNVPLVLVGQDKMSDSHLFEKDTDVH